MSTLEERKIGAVVGALVADAAGKYLFLIYLKQAKDLSFHGIRIQCTTQSCLYNCVHLRWLPDRTLQNFKACILCIYVNLMLPCIHHVHKVHQIVLPKFIMYECYDHCV